MTLNVNENNPILTDLKFLPYGRLFRHNGAIYRRDVDLKDEILTVTEEHAVRIFGNRRLDVEEVADWKGNKKTPSYTELATVKVLEIFKTNNPLMGWFLRTSQQDIGFTVEAIDLGTGNKHFFSPSLPIIKATSATLTINE